MIQLAPVVLFAYDRPDHTRRTLEALQLNSLAKSSELFIFADGPKKGADQATLDRIHAVRALAMEADWCGRVRLFARDVNVGLARNIVEGVTEVINRYGKVVVLEDDIVTSAGFLEFCNQALTKYEHQDEVMHVSGFSFNSVDPHSVGADTYFYRVPTCWGWATWKRAWDHYDDDATRLFLDLCKVDKLGYFDFSYSGVFLGQLNANRVGVMRTWAVKWYASVLLAGGIALHPASSMIENIGFDGTGTNSGKTDAFAAKSLSPSTKLADIPLVENRYVARAMSLRYRNTVFNRFRSYLANRWWNYYLVRRSQEKLV